MNGITILNETTLTLEPPARFIVTMVIIFFGVMFLLSIIGIIKSIKDRDRDCVIASLIATLCSILLESIFVFGFDYKCNHPVTQYEVLISDEVNFNEFYQKYEIIEQRGEIYVIQERQSQKEN